MKREMRLIIVNFADKKIMDAGNQYIQHMGRYPVIYLSKSSKQSRLGHNILDDKER